MTDPPLPSAWRHLPPSDAVDAARADQDARWRAGNPRPAEEYLQALPAVAADPELALVLIYGEVLSRTAAGERPTPDEYRDRFPQWADQLALQFQLHSALGKASTGDRDPDATNPIDQTRSTDATGAVNEGLSDTFGPFVAREVIGRGGMGVVLSAHDPTLDREVAVKTLRPGHPLRVAATARFHREARISAKVQHPGVPPVYAVGELPDGTPYLAMKLVSGRTLADLLAARPHPAADLTRFLDIVEQVAQAVGSAHAAGVIHRDLKPANVMVGAFAEVQVMDWGLAKELDSTDFAVGPAADDPPAGTPTPDSTVAGDGRADGDGLTRVGTMLGTPAYMAPEQAHGQPTGPPADVFGLGAILCVVLTGHPPFAAPDVHAAVRKAMSWDTADAFRRLAQCKAEPGVVELCQRCLARAPADRPADGGAVAAALADLRAAAGDRLKRADLIQLTALTRQQEFRKRMWVGAGAAGVFVLALLALGGWYVVDQEAQAKARSEAARAAANAREREVEEGENQMAAAERGKRLALEREVEVALSDVGTALTDFRKAGEDDWKAETALARARGAQARAEGLLTTVEDGWGQKERRPSSLAPRVTAAGERVTVAEKAHKLVGELDSIAFSFLDWHEPTERRALTAQSYAAAFATATAAGPPDPDRIDELVSSHPVPAALVEAVFDWHWHATDADRPKLAAVLDRATRRVPFAAAWWEASRDTTPAGTARLVKLAGSKEAEALADRAKPGIPNEQPRWVLNRVYCDLAAHGERAAAERVLRRGLERYPGDYRLNLRFALARAAEGTPAARQEAVRYAMVAAGVRPRAAVACRLVGRLLADEEPAAALVHLNRTVELNGNDVSALLDRAEALTKLGEPTRAAADYAAVTKLAKPVQERLTVISKRWAAGEKAAAEAELRRLLPGMPDEAFTQLRLAELYQSMGRPVEAERAYRAAAAAAPITPGFQLRLAQHLERRSADLPDAKRREMLTEAVEVLSSSADRFVTRHTPYWHLVFLHTRLGDGPKAVAAGERAAELGKGNADAEWVLGFAQLTAGKLDAAAVTALGFARKHPSDPRGADLLAQIAVAKPSQEAPAEVRGLLHAGLADLYQGEHARAAAAFRRVAELDGKLACGHLNLGLARYKLGDWNGATAALTTAAELDPAVAGQVKGMLARVETARKQTPREVLPPPRRAEGN